MQQQRTVVLRPEAPGICRSQHKAAAKQVLDVSHHITGQDFACSRQQNWDEVVTEPDLQMSLPR